MLGPDPESQARMAAEMDRSLEQVQRDFGAFFKRLAIRWALRWAVIFGVIFLLTQAVDWLGWLWWIALPLAVLSLAVPLLFRRFLMKRLGRMRGQMGAMGGGGATIDGHWRESGSQPHSGTPGAAPGDEPAGVIIDQRAPDDDSRL